MPYSEGAKKQKTLGKKVRVPFFDTQSRGGKFPSVWLVFRCSNFLQVVLFFPKTTAEQNITSNFGAAVLLLLR